MAYAVANLVEILEQDQHRLDLVASKDKIQNFLEKARSWKDILLPSLCLIPVGLEIRIIDAACKAEDVIEVHIRNRILQPDDDDDQLDLLTDLVQEFESIIRTAMDIVKDDNPKLQLILPVDHLTSEQVQWYPKLDPRTKDDVPAIFEDDFQTLKERLTGEGPSKLQIIVIDGIPGIGKRTLARRLFNDPLIVTHFPTRAWLSSPLAASERSCLLNLLEGLGMLDNVMLQKDVDELKVYIKKALKSTKYFIVIHDVVDKGNWNTFKSLFRDYGVGACILYTTYGGFDEVRSSTYELYPLRFLTDSESWLLLCQKVFGQEHCSDELECIGRCIVQLCYGVPQAVSLVAGVLATSKNTPAAWELVAKSLAMKLVGGGTENIQSMLFTLIYYHLPYYLRPCLLYIGAFYESRDIKASKVIKLWIAEGFVKQRAGECLEDIAETYLRILIDKNLLYLTHEEPIGRVKAFQHQLLLKFLCWFVADEEMFLGSKYMQIVLKSMKEVSREEKLARRLSAHGTYLASDGSELPTLARSFLSVSGASRRQVSKYLKLRLLRVLEVFQSEFYQFPREILQQVLLRYLAFSCHSNLPNSFSILRNLQTLLIRRLPEFRAFSLPSDLWGLTQLRHVKCKENFILCNPRNGKDIIHRDLQTLSNMQLFAVTNEFLRQIPNIRNLGIFCNIAMETVFDLTSLDKLETLKYSSDWSLASRNFLAFLTLPVSLRKLNLCLCRIPSEFMEVVGSLPILEHLKLQKSDFIGVDSAKSELTWETVEGGFPKLLSLEMIHLNLVHWKTQASHFPSLMHLNVQYCYAMVEVPLDIGNIQTLELIQVTETSPLALVSALKIKEDQEGRGNKLLQLRTYTFVF